MGKFRYGCETFSWIMSGQKYIGKMPHICEIISRAGYAGIEPGEYIMREYFKDKALMKDLLEEHGLKLAAMGAGGGFPSAALSEKERSSIERVFDYLESFPDPRITLSHGSRDRSDLEERRRNAMACVNEIGRLATDRGITAAFHPTSGSPSIFRTPEDYRMMLDSLDNRVVGYAADSGHIVNGGMDVYEMFTTYASVIRHVHLKDITAEKSWAPTGEGIIDFPRILKILHEADYTGWIDMEEESSEAQQDPDAATLKNGEYLKNTMLPLGY